MNSQCSFFHGLGAIGLLFFLISAMALVDLISGSSVPRCESDDPQAKVERGVDANGRRYCMVTKNGKVVVAVLEVSQ